MTERSAERERIRELCRERHRCIVLALLAEHQRSLTLHDVTKAIVRNDRDAPLTEIEPGVVAETQRALETEHVPTLDDAGLVEYDRERGLLEPTVELDQLASHVTTVAEDDLALDEPIDL